MTEGILRGVTGPRGSRLARLLGDGLEPVAPLRPLTGCLGRIVAEAQPPPDHPELGSDLPDGAARPEALAARMRAAGHGLRWEAPTTVDGLTALLELCRARGRSSVALLRSDPSLVTRMQLGAWFDSPWRTRLLRRAGLGGSTRALAALGLVSRRWLSAAADLAFWAGVREEATPLEWSRLTASSYVALVYHRFAGELKAGQDRVDIAPRRFARQLRALRALGFRPLPAERLLSFQSGAAGTLPRRMVAITVDDAVADCLEPLARHAAWKPQLFVPTAELGGSAHWLDDEPLAGWEEIAVLADAGVAVGSHARHHRRLTRLDAEERRAELLGSLADLRNRLTSPLEAIAFPNGDHDARLCREAREAGFRAAFTTAKGRNGAGTDPWCLKRVSVHGHDGMLAILWKASTGEALPAGWLRLRGLLGGRRHS